MDERMEGRQETNGMRKVVETDGSVNARGTWPRCLSVCHCIIPACHVVSWDNPLGRNKNRGKKEWKTGWIRLCRYFFFFSERLRSITTMRVMNQVRTD